VTDGVPITQREFDAQLERSIAALDEDGAALTADDYVAMASEGSPTRRVI